MACDNLFDSLALTACRLGLVLQDFLRSVSRCCIMRPDKGVPNVFLVHADVCV